MVLKEWTGSEGYHCLIVEHSSLGHLCGYVGVPSEHPMFDKDYTGCLLPSAKPRGERPYDLEEPKMPDRWLKRSQARLVCDEDDYCGHRPESILRCHGGITYSGRTIPGMKPELYYFGFDCGHLGDLSPGLNETLSKVGLSPDTSGVYRDQQYVEYEITDLVKQLSFYQRQIAEMSAGKTP